MKGLGALILAALALAYGCALAGAQSSILQGGPFTPGHVPQYVSAGSIPVLADGGAAGGGLPGANVTELGITAIGTGTAPYVGQGTGPFGTNVCDYDAPTNNATGYHYLCFSPNATVGGVQGGQLVYGAAGAAAPLPFQLCVNGTCFTPGGSIASLQVGTTTIGNGTNTRCLYDNNGILGEQACTPIVPSALTKTDDTNVTLTLGGTPATALLQATSITVGWTGTLAGARGGTGVNNAASTITIGGNVAFSGAFGFTGTITGTTNVTFPTSGTLATTATANVITVSNSDGTLTISPTSANVIASLALGHANTWSAVQTFTNSDIALLGSSTGFTTFTSANAGASNFTLTFPAITDTLAGKALANGGTNASLTANNGGIVYSTASALAILGGTVTANQVLLSGSSTTPAWSTATYPATTTINQLLYSSSANTIAGLATANGGILNTSAGGVPSITPTPTLGVASSVTGALALANSGNSGVVTVQAPSSATSWTFTFPTSGGTNNYVLTTNGSGVTSWTNPSAGGTVTSVATSGWTSGGTITTSGTITAPWVAALVYATSGGV